MARKTITLILQRADRKLWDGGPVRLEVTDVCRVPLKVLFNQRLKAKSHTILMELDLHFDAGQVYGISVDAAKHRSAWQLINRRTFLRQQGTQEVEVADSVVRLMLAPRRTSSPDLDAGYDLLRARGSPLVADSTGIPWQTFRDLEVPAKMALMNIEAKLRDTRINGISLLSYVEGARYVAVDRLFLFVRSELKQIVEDSAEFASAPGHGAPDDTPMPLPAHPDSWKHRRFGAGNVQLSFSRAAERLPGSGEKQVFSIDTDIDLAKGVAHVCEWMDNHVLHPGQKTDQSQVYCLLFSQGILPEYTLAPLSA
jgi:hypothetical protein